MVVVKGHTCCGLYRTHVKTYKKKFNEIKNFEKTPQIRVGIKGVNTKKVKFSLPNSASKEQVVGDEEYEDAKNTWDDDDEVKDHRGLEQWEQYPQLEIDEPHKKRTTGELQTISFENNWASDEGKPRNWIKEIQDEMNSLRMKGINIDEVLSVLVKIMKKVKPCVGLTSMDLN